MKKVEKLHPKIREYILGKGWKLNQIQNKSIDCILEDIKCEYDYILSSTTASGKTEAVFWPLLTRIYNENEKPAKSYEVLYISPLKALINDILPRIEKYADFTGRKAYPRHGDIKSKTRLLEIAQSRGVLLTTPESLEARFIKNPDSLDRVFRDLKTIVIDELHSYFDTPRGAQIISLSARLESLLKNASDNPRFSLQRIALSATISNIENGNDIVRSFLRPSDPDRVKILTGKSSSSDIKFSIYSFAKQTKSSESGKTFPTYEDEIAEHLYNKFKSVKKGLIFTNSRRDAELYAEKLNSIARNRKLVKKVEDYKEEQDIEDENDITLDLNPETRRFWPHHGSLNRQNRSKAECAMRDGEVSSVMVCTSTLELGIDVGLIEETAQIGPGYSVSSLRQRLGRSGRRENQDPSLLSYIVEPEISDDDHPVVRLCLPTFQTLAQINLLQKNAFEEPNNNKLQLSTLIQQLLSCAKQFENDQGLGINEAKKILLEQGPFKEVQRKQLFEPLIEHLSKKLYPLILITEAEKIGLTGNSQGKLKNFNFYAAFQTPKEYIVKAGSRTIGSFLPRYPYGPGDCFLLGGIYWMVEKADHANMIFNVIRAKTGQAPFFSGEGLAPSDIVVNEMKQIYDNKESLNFTFHKNHDFENILDGAYKAYREIFKNDSKILSYGDTAIIFPWIGTVKQITLVSALKWYGLSATALGIAIEVKESVESIKKALGDILKHLPRSSEELASYATKLTFEKHDRELSPALKRLNFASSILPSERHPPIHIERPVPCSPVEPLQVYLYK